MRFNKWTLGLAAGGTISLASAVRAEPAESPFAELLERLETDIRFDCHRTEIAFNRSDTKKELVALGPKIFPALAEHLRGRFPDMETSRMNAAEVDWDMFGVWVWLICSIRDAHGLPPTPYYRKGVRFADQDMQRWHDYCLAHSPV